MGRWNAGPVPVAYRMLYRSNLTPSAFAQSVLGTDPAPTVHWPHVSARSHPGVRYALLRGERRLRPGIRVSGERPQFLLSQLQRARCAIGLERSRGAARGAASTDRSVRGGDRLDQSV